MCQLGIVKSKQRDSEVLYCPGICLKIEEMLKNCSKCADFWLPRQLTRIPKSIQRFYHDYKRVRGPHALLNPGNEVKNQPCPENPKWSPGIIVRPHNVLRSYVVGCGSQEYCRNIQHIQQTKVKANDASHRPDYVQWTEMSETMSDK